jgi:hypothetical protein
LLPEGIWIANEVDRFGPVSYGDELPSSAVPSDRQQPAVAEEFDIVE